MNCFVFYVVVDGVLCGGQSLAWAPGLFAICTVLGLGGETPRRVSNIALCFACVRRAALSCFINPNARSWPPDC